LGIIAIQALNQRDFLKKPDNSPEICIAIGWNIDLTTEIMGSTFQTN
jgi:hypothetical protein